MVEMWRASEGGMTTRSLPGRVSVDTVLRSVCSPQSRALALLAALLLHASLTPTASAFSLQMQDDARSLQQQPDLDDYMLENNDNMENEIDDYPMEDHVDEYINVMKRYMRPYRRWGHRSRFAWRYMKDRMCYRQRCKWDKDCCRRWSLCDKSAKVCTDCWYGSSCKTEQDCCMRYPYCSRTWKRNTKTGRRYIAGGKCVSKL